MVLVRLNLVGDGSALNQFRVDLRTYNGVNLNTTNRTFVVDIPGADIAVQLPDPATAAWQTVNEQPVLVAMTAGQLQAWYRLLDSRYGAFGVQYRPVPM